MKINEFFEIFENKKEHIYLEPKTKDAYTEICLAFDKQGYTLKGGKRFIDSDFWSVYGSDLLIRNDGMYIKKSEMGVGTLIQNKDIEFDSKQQAYHWDVRLNRPRVLLDMDDVITNFLGYLLKVYNNQTGKDVKIEEFRSWDLTTVVGPEVFDIFKEEGFFSKLPQKNDSISVLKQLIESTRYDVYIITACTTVHELAEKIDWMNKMLPTFNPKRIIMCTEKEIINGSLIVDDKLDNLDRCAPFMHTIVYDMPHNQECEHRRIKKLQELPEILEELFYPNTETSQ